MYPLADLEARGVYSLNYNCTAEGLILHIRY